jgi:hypothetical protein
MQTFQTCTTEIPAALPSRCDGRVKDWEWCCYGSEVVASCGIALWDPNSHNSPIQGPYLALRTCSILLLKRTPMILFERRGTLSVHHRTTSTYTRKILLFLKPKKTKHLYKTLEEWRSPVPIHWARVTQQQPVYGSLEACYDSVVDELQLSWCWGFTYYITYLVAARSYWVGRMKSGH